MRKTLVISSAISNTSLAQYGVWFPRGMVINYQSDYSDVAEPFLSIIKKIENDHEKINPKNATHMG